MMNVGICIIKNGVNLKDRVSGVTGEKNVEVI